MIYWCITITSHQNTPNEMAFVVVLVNNVILNIRINGSCDTFEDFRFPMIYTG
jgi:hypothetical protein